MRTEQEVRRLIKALEFAREKMNRQGGAADLANETGTMIEALKTFVGLSREDVHAGIRLLNLTALGYENLGLVEKASVERTIAGYLLWLTGIPQPMLEPTIEILINECESQISETN